MKPEIPESEIIFEEGKQRVKTIDEYSAVVTVGGFKFLIRYVPKSKKPGDQGVMVLADMINITPELMDALLTAYEGYPNFVRIMEVLAISKTITKDIAKRKEVSIKHMQMVIGLIREVQSQPFWFMTPEVATYLVDTLQHAIKQIESGEYEAKEYHVSKAKPKPPHKRSRMKHQGYVYLMRTSFGYWKIGFTKNPKQRLSAMVKLPFTFEYEYLIPTHDMKGLEWQLHEIFKDYRAKGTEFFTLTDEQVAWIKSEYKGHEAK
jgi:hypothetical protein